MFLSCEKEDEIQTDTISTSIYNKDISNYLNLLKTQSNKKNSLKIEALVNAIDLNSVKIYTLKTTEKLLVADLKSLKGFEISDKTKAIFFVYENEITRSNIVTFNVKVPFDNLDKVILSVLDMKKNKDNYTGKISFYDMHQNISLSNEFENGKLTFNGMARRKTTRNITGKAAGCIDWYWVTGSSYTYLYTTCDCYAYRMSGIKCGGSGAGGLSSSSSGPAYPSNPPDKTLFTYIDEDGQIITKRYNEEALTWEFFSISLSEVVINNNPTKYSYLIIQWPIDQQKVVTLDFIYTYDGASGNWNGEPTTHEEMPPSCESFNFVQTSPNWQESAVKNIRFVIVLYDPPLGVYIKQIIEFPQPILFGSPMNLFIGNTNISSGAAAETGAEALRISMQETVNLYGNKTVDELTVRLYFESRIKNNYSRMVPDGRVNINAANYSVAPTEYKSTWFGTANCN